MSALGRTKLSEFRYGSIFYQIIIQDIPCLKAGIYREDLNQPAHALFKLIYINKSGS